MYKQTYQVSHIGHDSQAFECHLMLSYMPPSIPIRSHALFTIMCWKISSKLAGLSGVRVGSSKFQCKIVIILFMLACLLSYIYTAHPLPCTPTIIIWTWYNLGSSGISSWRLLAMPSLTRVLLSTAAYAPSHECNKLNYHKQARYLNTECAWAIYVQ